MATIYYKETVDTSWDSVDNWYSDANRTVPAGNIPQTGDTVWIGIEGDTDTPVITPPTSPIVLDELHLWRGYENNTGITSSVFLQCDNISANNIYVSDNSPLNTLARKWVLKGNINGNLFITGSNEIGATSQSTSLTGSLYSSQNQNGHIRGAFGMIGEAYLSGDRIYNLGNNGTIQKVELTNNATLGYTTIHGNVEAYDTSTIVAFTIISGSLEMFDDSKIELPSTQSVEVSSSVKFNNNSYLTGGIIRSPDIQMYDSSSISANPSSNVRNIKLYGSSVFDSKSDENVYFYENSRNSGEVLNYICADVFSDELINPNGFGTVLDSVLNVNLEPIKKIVFDNKINETSIGFNGLETITLRNGSINHTETILTADEIYFEDSSRNNGSVVGNVYFEDSFNSVGQVEGQIRLNFVTGSEVDITTNFSGESYIGEEYAEYIFNANDQPIQTINVKSGSLYEGRFRNVRINVFQNSEFNGYNYEENPVYIYDTSFVGDNSYIYGGLHFVDQLNRIGGYVEQGIYLDFLTSGSVTINNSTLNQYLKYANGDDISDYEFINNGRNEIELTGNIKFTDSINNGTIHGTGSFFGNSYSNGGVEYAKINDFTVIDGGQYQTVIAKNYSTILNGNIENLYLYDESFITNTYDITNITIVGQKVARSMLEASLNNQGETKISISSGINGSSVIGMI